MRSAQEPYLSCRLGVLGLLWMSLLQAAKAENPILDSLILTLCEVVFASLLLNWR